MGVVAGREVLEADAAEQRVVVAGALQLGQPVGPDHAQHDRFEVAVGVAVLRVHGEDDQVLPAVAPVGGGLEGEQRVQEVRHREAAVGPAAQVPHERGVVGGVVGQQRGELLDGADHPPYGLLGLRGSGGALGGAVDRSVRGLPWPDLLHGILEDGPRRVLHHPAHGKKIFPSAPICTRISVMSHPPPENLA
ncbi:hypothetical protein GCM10020295_09540 [Streptomyces cinereospinus]